MEFLEILKYVLPSLVVMGMAYLMMRQFANRDDKRQQTEMAAMRMELMKENKKATLPVIMAAYERLVLFLERIDPNSILSRTMEQGMTSLDLQKALLMTIRAEFEHNFSQQLYVSDNAWKAVRDTKEVVIQLINQSAQAVAYDAKAIELGKRIVENYAQIETSPISAAISILKQELATVA